MALSLQHTFAFSCLLRGFWAPVWVLLIKRHSKRKARCYKLLHICGDVIRLLLKKSQFNSLVWGSLMLVQTIIQVCKYNLHPIPEANFPNCGVSTRASIKASGEQEAVFLSIHFLEMLPRSVWSAGTSLSLSLRQTRNSFASCGETCLPFSFSTIPSSATLWGKKHKI